jgi:hypothetical protein
MKPKETQEGMIEAYKAFIFSIPKGVGLEQALKNCDNVLNARAKLGTMSIYRNIRERRNQKKSPDQRPGD